MEPIHENVGCMERGGYTTNQYDADFQRRLDTWTAHAILHDAEVAMKKGEAIGERKKAVAIALIALKLGRSIEDTSNLTGLPIEQIEELIKLSNENKV